MQLSFTCQNATLYLRLLGEVDEHNASMLRREADRLCERYAPNLQRAVLDLSQVSFMDSTGIGFLMGRYKKLSQFGIPMYLSNANPQAERILQMSGIYTLIPKL